MTEKGSVESKAESNSLIRPSWMPPGQEVHWVSPTHHLSGESRRFLTSGPGHETTVRELGGKFQLIDTALEKWSLHTVTSRSFNPIHSYSIMLNTYTLHTHKCTQMSSHDFTYTLHHQWQGICFCSVYNWIHWWSLKTTSHDQVPRVCMMYGHNIHRMLCIVFWTHSHINLASKH